jgi:hypothetical protein
LYWASGGGGPQKRRAAGLGHGASQRLSATSKIAALHAETHPEEQSGGNGGGGFKTIAAIAGLIRDLGVIIGIPLVVAVALKLYDIELKSFEAQVKANEAQIKVLEAQNSLLKETQYDRAASLMEGQKKVFQMERESSDKKIAELNEQFANLKGPDTGALHAQLLEALKKREAIAEREDAVTEFLKEFEGRVKLELGYRIRKDENVIVVEPTNPEGQQIQRASKSRGAVRTGDATWRCFTVNVTRCDAARTKRSEPIEVWSNPDQ